MAPSYARYEKYTIQIIHTIQFIHTIHTVQNLHTLFLFSRSDPISGGSGSSGNAPPLTGPETQDVAV
ncbi:hypothetical protein FCG84_021240 [Klebsiella pneumoniae]|nr:hypothetical protein CEG93_26710 [Raoultella ornithinolytica]OWP47348.1 hypothetical protein CEG93_00365 [Raoultella ornithinolytica]TYX76546.1 hypothetical protein FCG84_021240 [Klebsiella pneumoniae]